MKETSMINDDILRKLRERAGIVRRDIVQMIHESGTAGHYGGSLSCADILTCLYFHTLRHDPGNPLWDDRDRFVLSKGHAAPALYAVLAEAGYFSRDHLSTFKRMGSILQGHPDMKLTPGVEMSTGALGQGLSVSLGMALAGRLDRKGYHVYVLLGDGEIDEGSVWEAAMASSHYELDNLTAILDRNCLQISGSTEECMHLEPLAEKWRAFGWEALCIDGHEVAQILEALHRAAEVKGKPSIIIARTVKGKGIGFLENRPDSHSCTLSEEQYQQVRHSLQVMEEGKE
jgi:transketolase